MDLFVGSAVVLEGVGVRAEEYGSGDKVDNMPTATKRLVLFVKAKVNG